MKVEILDGLGKPLVVNATRVLVTDDAGTPLAFAVSFVRDGAGREIVRLGHAGEKDFNAQMRANGINRTVLVTRTRLPEPPPR